MDAYCQRQAVLLVLQSWIPPMCASFSMVRDSTRTRPPRTSTWRMETRSMLWLSKLEELLNDCLRWNLLHTLFILTILNSNIIRFPWFVCFKGYFELLHPRSLDFQIHLFPKMEQAQKDCFRVVDHFFMKNSHQILKRCFEAHLHFH